MGTGNIHVDLVVINTLYFLNRKKCTFHMANGYFSPDVQKMVIFYKVETLMECLIEPFVILSIYIDS